MTDSEYLPSHIARLNWVSDSLVTHFGLNAVRLTDATHTYSCHSYAWYISEGGTILPVQMAGDIRNYFEDATYSYDGSPSYLPFGNTSGPEETATHTLYTDDNHSARKIQNSYPRPIEGGRDYVSKWGDYGLYQHAKNHDIYYLGASLGHNFKKLKTTHYGTLSTYPKTWVGAGGITHTVTGNLTVNTTLSILPGVTVNFQNGVTMTVNGTLNINSNLTIPAGVTLVVNPGATLNFASGTSLTVFGTLNAVGTSNNNITFTRSGTSGTWGGINFQYYGSGTLRYCNISNASTGIIFSVNGEASNCYIHDNTSVSSIL